MLISNLETLSEKATLFYVKNIQVENTAKDDIWRECRIDHDTGLGDKSDQNLKWRKIWMD